MTAEDFSLETLSYKLNPRLKKMGRGEICWNDNYTIGYCRTKANIFFKS